MSKSKTPKTWNVQGDFWGWSCKVKAHSKSEAKSIARKKIREGKIKPQICNIYADRTWED